MRTVVAVVVVSSLAAVSAQAGELHRSMSGRLWPVQAVAAEPPPLERVTRESVTRAPLETPAAQVVETPAAQVVETPAPPAPPATAPGTTTDKDVAAAPSPAAPAAEPAPAAPQPPAAQAPVAQSPAAQSPGVQAPVTQAPAGVPPAAAAASSPMFSMPAEQLTAIGVGVIGGLVVLDSVGVPTAAAAFLGGLAGQLWYSYNSAPPSPDYSVTQRITSRSWHDAAVRDGAVMNRRWLYPVNLERGG